MSKNIYKVEIRMEGPNLGGLGIVEVRADSDLEAQERACLDYSESSGLPLGELVPKVLEWRL